MRVSAVFIELHFIPLQFAEFTEFQHEALKAEAKRVASEIEETTKKANTQWRAKELQRLHVRVCCRCR